METLDFLRVVVEEHSETGVKSAIMDLVEGPLSISHTEYVESLICGPLASEDWKLIVFNENEIERLKLAKQLIGLLVAKLESKGRVVL